MHQQGNNEEISKHNSQPATQTQDSNSAAMTHTCTKQSTIYKHRNTHSTIQTPNMHSSNTSARHQCIEATQQYINNATSPQHINNTATPNKHERNTASS